MGFPTANIALTLPIPEGVYFSHVSVAEKQYNALTFIGSAKTYHETLYQSESYLLDFSASLYHQIIHIGLIKKFRGNRAFPSEKSLIHAMKKDKKAARIFFTKQ